MNKVREAGKVINRAPSPMEISFVVSYMTELSLTSVSKCKHRARGRTEDNAVIHDQTHVVLFASNEYFNI